ncbi:uncharacterized protein BXZ73DRAFT_99819 [Epithele typhae]|uniref:uncharacterized protein n=1 Tax=Epithele typhae TaxID=378194 RepID=UPI0020087086|nr:uncharacterized protein BXZ73DRAFT_99819 [Epithele typhae]KAH9938755.1 hypothetical protein BXZ73DRAFT_99819 [Epithele typhae]
MPTPRVSPASSRSSFSSSPLRLPLRSTFSPASYPTLGVFKTNTRQPGSSAGYGRLPPVVLFVDALPQRGVRAPDSKSDGDSEPQLQRTGSAHVAVPYRLRFPDVTLDHWEHPPPARPPAWATPLHKQGGLGSDLKLLLIADRNLSILRDHGVLIGDEDIALRGLFIIDPKGNLRRVRNGAA